MCFGNNLITINALRGQTAEILNVKSRWRIQLTVNFKVLCVDGAEFYKMQTTEWSQHAENRVTFTGVVLISYGTEEGIFFFIRAHTVMTELMWWVRKYLDLKYEFYNAGILSGSKSYIKRTEEIYKKMYSEKFWKWVST